MFLRVEMHQTRAVQSGKPHFDESDAKADRIEPLFQKMSFYKKKFHYRQAFPADFPYIHTHKEPPPFPARHPNSPPAIFFQLPALSALHLPPLMALLKDCQ